MNWNAFTQELNSGALRSAYLFRGPEEYIKSASLASLRKKLLPPGLEALNEVVLEGCTTRSIIESAETLPVMCEKRLVVVRDWPPLGGDEGKHATSEIESLAAWLEDAPESTVLVFYQRAAVEDSKKKKSGAEALSKRLAIVDFDYLSEAELRKWCDQRLGKSGKRIYADAQRLLMDMAGRDLTRLALELDKLVAYIGAGEEIRAADVAAVVTPSTEYTVFQILDQLRRGDMDKASVLLKAALTDGESASRLIGLFAGQLRVDVHFKAALDGGGNSVEVARALGMKDSYAQMVARRVRSMSLKQLEAACQACVRTEAEVKSGLLRDRAALDRLMLEIVDVISHPEHATKSLAASSKL